MVTNTAWFLKGPSSTIYLGVADVANFLQLQVSQELTDALNAGSKTQAQQDLIKTFETELTNKVKKILELIKLARTKIIHVW